MINPLSEAYPFLKQVVCEEGYGSEIEWQASVSFDKLNKSSFMKEISWVIISSGMKEKIVRKAFNELSQLFIDWKDAEEVLKNRETILKKALTIFNNRGKMLAIIDSIEIIQQNDFTVLKSKIRKSPIVTLQMFPYIGPVTSFHLAKNIGLQVAKPDRHLIRIANLVGYESVQTFCAEISKTSGDSIPVVDIVFWRFATIEPDYISVLKSLCIQ
jgi:hypothetical protein